RLLFLRQVLKVRREGRELLRALLDEPLELARVPVGRNAGRRTGLHTVRMMLRHGFTACNQEAARACRPPLKRRNSAASNSQRTRGMASTRSAARPAPAA